MLGYIQSLSLTARIIAFLVICLIGVVAVGALIGVIVPYRIRFSRVKRSTKNSMFWVGLLLTAASALVAASFTLPSGHGHGAVKHGDTTASSIGFDVPEPNLPGNPLAVMGCVAQVRGYGQLQSDDELVIASAAAGSKIDFFVPVNWLSRNRWDANIYLGTRSNAGDRFKIGRASCRERV